MTSPPNERDEPVPAVARIRELAQQALVWEKVLRMLDRVLAAQREWETGR